MAIPDLDTLNIHSVRLRWRQWGITAGPLYGARICAWVTSIPEAQTYFHGSLGILGAGFISGEGTHNLAID